MPEITKVAVVQLCATPDVAENLRIAADLVREAHTRDAEVVMLPEAFAFLGPDKEKRKILERLPVDPYDKGGPIFEQCRELACRYGVHLQFLLLNPQTISWLSWHSPKQPQYLLLLGQKAHQSTFSHLLQKVSLHF